LEKIEKFRKQTEKFVTVVIYGCIYGLHCRKGEDNEGEIGESKALSIKRVFVLGGRTALLGRFLKKD
jgi:hypothetical protein